MSEQFKTISLQGKEYIQVAERLRWFRENHKDARILTDIKLVENVGWGVEGTISPATKEKMPIGMKYICTAQIIIGDKIVATAHAMKNAREEFNLEKTETRAIGRALGVLGVGIEYGVSTYDEVNEALRTTKNESEA